MSMPKFKIETSSKHGAQDTFKKIRNVLENDKDLRKMDAGYKCDFNEAAMSGKAKGSQFEANMTVKSDGAGSKVEVEVTLPMLLTPLKGVVQSTLQKKLESALS